MEKKKTIREKYLDGFDQYILKYYPKKTYEGEKEKMSEAEKIAQDLHRSGNEKQSRPGDEPIKYKHEPSWLGENKEASSFFIDNPDKAEHYKTMRGYNAITDGGRMNKNEEKFSPWTKMKNKEK
jgi:hypothetical protein